MCRFLIYAGSPALLEPLLHRAPHGLVEQSRAACEMPGGSCLNADGVGVGWYQPVLTPEPGRYRSPLPAWSDLNLASLARVIASPCFFAHVRAASPGSPVGEANCHPFAHGRFLWMHNGTTGGFREMRDRLRLQLSRAAFEAVAGTTDSEHLFALFLDLWRREGEPAEPEGLLAAFQRTLHRLHELREEAGIEAGAAWNLALTDGATIICCRHAVGTGEEPRTLYVAEGAFAPDPVPRVDAASPAAGVLIASEPLFPDPAWRAVPRDTILFRPPGQAVRELPLPGEGGR